MRLAVHLTIAAVLMPGVCRAAGDRSPTPAQTLADLKQQIQKIDQDHEKRYNAAKTDQERNNSWEKYRADRDAVVKRAVELARKNPSDPASLEALTWVITGGLGWGKETNAALDELTARYVTSDKLEQICLMAALMNDNPSAVRFLEAVLQKSPHRSMRGVACLSLGRNFKYQAEAAHYFKRPGADDLQKQAEAYYERVVKEFPDVEARKRKLGDRARAALFEMRNLVEGKQAPDIQGEDIDGKKFRLSDYRGKVVVLDFWGNW